MKRSDVYKMIDGERDFQRARGYPDGEWAVAHWLIFMQSYVNKGMWDMQYISDEQALEQVRKIGALAVACMENLDTKPRQ